MVRMKVSGNTGPAPWWKQLAVCGLIAVLLYGYASCQDLISRRAAGLSSSRYGAYQEWADEHRGDPALQWLRDELGDLDQLVVEESGPAGQTPPGPAPPTIRGARQ